MKKNKIYLSAICAVAINLSAADLGTINVESSTIEDLTTDLKTESSTINTIDEQTIEKINPKNINELLQTIPGITADVRSDVVEIHIRGINQQEFMWEDTGVAVIIDGIPVQQDGGKVRGINIDEIESIKVIKGSASYLYGANATAGAVIITTKKAKSGNGGYVSLEGGSYGYKNAKAKLYGSTDKFTYNILGGYKYEDGYWDSTQNDQTTASGKFTYFLDDTSDLTFSADYTDKYQETTRGSVTGVTAAEENPTGDDDDWAYQKDYNMDIYKYFITYNKDLEDDGSIKINTYYYNDLYNYLSSPQDTNDDDADDTYTRDNDDDIKQYGIKTEYKNSNDTLGYMVGVDVGKKEYDEYSETIADYFSSSWRGDTYYWKGENSLDTSEETNYALYAETKYQVNSKFTAIFNARYDYNYYDISEEEHDYDEDTSTWSDTKTSDSESFTNLTYRLGGTYQLTDKKTLFANLSTGFRNPSVSQIVADDEYNEEENKNISLDTQTSITYEVGMRGTTPFGAKCEASIFVTDTKDIISKVDGTYYWGSDYYDNVGDTRNQGFELSLNGKAKQKLSYSVAYTYLDAFYTAHNPFIVSLEDEDKTYDIVDNKLPRVPHHKIDIVTTYQVTPKIDIMGELYAQSSYYADETNLVEMSGYSKVNLRVDYKQSKALSFFAKVDNVTDNQYYRTVFLFSDRNEDNILDDEDASITVDPGRVFYAGLKYRF